MVTGQAVSPTLAYAASPFLGPKGRLSEFCLLRGRREPQENEPETRVCFWGGLEIPSLGG
jgi:hypothetical protein